MISHIQAGLQNKAINISEGHLTEAVKVSIRYSEYFRYYYNKIRAKRNANSATVAVARRMLEVIYVMLKEGRAYIEKPVYIK